MPNAYDTRSLSGIELRQEGGRRPRLVGYAAIWDSKSFDLGGFVEIIRKGAFSRSLEEGVDIRAFVEHEPARIIGRRTANTLKIEEDNRGLRIEITPPDTGVGNDVVENIRAGNLDGCSFGFRTPPDGDRWDLKARPPLRELLDVDLIEVSIVAMPAYAATDVALRSMARATELAPPPTLDRLREKLAQQRAGWR